MNGIEEDNIRITGVAKPIDRRAYLAGLEAAAALLPWADPAALDRLRADADGKALAALNLLKCQPPGGIESAMFAALQAAYLGLNYHENTKVLAHRAAKYRDAVSHLEAVLELNQDMATCLPLAITRALTDTRLYLIKNAQEYDHMPIKSGISQKPNATIITLRQLRDRLFPGRSPPHEPLRLLAEVALGKIIGANEVKAALRRSRAGGYSGGEISK